MVWRFLFCSWLFVLALSSVGVAAELQRSEKGAFRVVELTREIGRASCRERV